MNECQACDPSSTVITIKNDEQETSSFEDSSSESDAETDVDEISYQNWRTVDGRISKSKISTSVEAAIATFRSYIKQLKTHIFKKRVQNKAYNHMKQTLGPNDLLIHVDFAESYSNIQQDAIQSSYFGQQTFSIFTACGYTKLEEDEHVKNDNVVVISEHSDHSRVGSMACLVSVVEKIEQIHQKQYPKLIIWSDGCASQFRSKYVFFMLTKMFVGKEIIWNYNERHHGKGPMDGLGGTVKNVIYRKVMSNMVTINNPKEFASSIEKFLPTIATVYLPSSNIQDEPEGTAEAPSIKGTLKIRVIKRVIQEGVIHLQFFELADEVKPFHTQSYDLDNGQQSCGHEPQKVQNDNKCGYCGKVYTPKGVWLKCPVCRQWYHEKCFHK